MKKKNTEKELWIRILGFQLGDKVRQKENVENFPFFPSPEVGTQGEIISIFPSFGLVKVAWNNGNKTLCFPEEIELIIEDEIG